MAEERNVGVARAPEASAAPDDPEVTKVELQRRMEEARESITQTVSEIKETVVNQYQQVRESINDSLDWREQYRRHTVPFTVGAAVGGLVLGYAVGGAVFGGSDDADDYEDEAVDYDAQGMVSSTGRAYAAQPILGRPAVAAAPPQYAAEASASYAGAGEDLGGGGGSSQLMATSASQASAPEEPKGPSLFERFRETKAYDRLQDELHTLGERAVEELSKTARTVVLPALLNRVKDMIGIDLSTQREVAERARVEQQTETVTAATAAAADAPRAGQATGGSV
jgi:hypothetical protein